jgi:hypothetical protein
VGFARSLFEALYESRQRQAARTIHKYRHLIDNAKARELWRAVDRSHAQASQSKPSSPSSWLVLVMKGARAWRTQSARSLIPQETARLQPQENLSKGKRS